MQQRPLHRTSQETGQVGYRSRRVLRGTPLVRPAKRRLHGSYAESDQPHGQR